MVLTKPETEKYIATDKIAAFTACFGIFIEQINYLLHTLNQYSRLGIPYVTQTVLLLFYVLVAYSVATHMDKILRVICVPLIISVLYLLSMMIYSYNFHYISENVTEKLFFFCIPVYMAMVTVKDYKLVFKYFRYFCIVSIITQTLSIVNSVFLPDYFVKTDYQGISYGLLVPLAYFILNNKKRIWEYLAIAFMMIEMLLSGGRGALVCGIICIGFRGVQNARKNKIWLPVITTVGLIIYIEFSNILNWIIHISEKYGFSGSLFKYFKMGDIFWDSGRDQIYEAAFKVISRFWPVGTGLGGDRYWLGEYGRYKYGSYTHNFFTEVLVHFGFMIGLPLLVWFVFRILYWFRQRNEQPETYILFTTLFFSGGFMGLMFSSSYLISVGFYALLAIIIYKRKPSIDSSLTHSRYIIRKARHVE